MSKDGSRVHQSVTRPSLRGSSRRRLLLASAAASSLAGILADTASGNTTYTYTPQSTTNDLWSAGTNWSATPPSNSTTTTLTFVGTNTTVLANSLTNINTDNDTGLFSLNILNLQGTGPASGAATITIASTSPSTGLDFVGTTPTVNLNALTGTAGLTYNVSAQSRSASRPCLQAAGRPLLTFPAGSAARAPESTRAGAPP